MIGQDRLSVAEASIIGASAAIYNCEVVSVKKGYSLERSDRRVGYLFVAPAVILFFIFSIIPFVYSFYLSLFTSKNGVMNKLAYCGFKNYLKALKNNEFWHSIEITLIFAVIVVAFHVTIGLMLALAVNKRFFGRTFVRAAFFIPVIMSTVVVGEIWRFMYSYPDGLFNKMLSVFGIASQPWIQSEKLALAAMIIVTVWRYVGYHMVIFLAALQEIPTDLYENAELAGANAWQKFRHITFPLLSNTTWFLIIISIINTSQAFDQIYVMTRADR